MVNKLNKVATFELKAVPPYSFELSVGKPLGYYWLTPFETFEKGTIWTAMRLGSGKVVGLKLKSIGTVGFQRLLRKQAFRVPEYPFTFVTLY